METCKSTSATQHRLLRLVPYFLHNRVQASDQRACVQTDVAKILQDDRRSVPERPHFFEVMHRHEECDLRRAQVARIIALALLR